MTRRKRRGGAVVTVMVILALGAVAIIYGPGWLDRYGDRVFSQSACTVTLADESHTLTVEQSNNAALISALSAREDLPARATTIALATAFQESGMRNIDYGDRDSVGLFQQRPSQGWGTVEQIMDPYYSAMEFYDHLVRVSGWRDMEITEAAQAVQRSAFPDAYAQHEGQSRLWASALRGHSGPVPVTCDLRSDDAGSPQEFIERVRADFGDSTYTIDVVDAGAEFTTLAVTPESGDQEHARALSAWAAAVASRQAVHAVALEGQYWSRDGLPVETSGTPQGAVTVVIRTSH